MRRKSRPRQQGNHVGLRVDLGQEFTDREQSAAVVQVRRGARTSQAAEHARAAARPALGGEFTKVGYELQLLDEPDRGMSLIVELSGVSRCSLCTYVSIWRRLEVTNMVLIR